jgi:hypothetical protein
VSDDSESGHAVEGESTPLQRVLDLLVFAPVGVALTVVEDLPGLIGKGRQRFETDVQNARVVGQFVVTHGQRQLVERVGKLFHREGTDGSSDSSDSESGTGIVGSYATSAPVGAAAAQGPASTSLKPEADPADGAIVEGALAGYDTLSASQVVRRLESLGPDELRALHRHEASHRNRRTILNRAHQILEAVEAGNAGAAGDAPAPTVAQAPAPAPATDRPDE